MFEGQGRETKRAPGGQLFQVFFPSYKTVKICVCDTARGDNPPGYTGA